ncbi:hypothetical protein DFH06DRAFT_1327712 [Mycena polygramma]|nr:hypothetical protein DFH06DRAFT_1327712 [Mycena polygramma]
MAAQPLDAPGAAQGTPYDLTRLLNSNDIPLAGEVQYIRRLLSDDQDEIDDLDNEITYLDFQLRDLFDNRRHLETRRRRHRAIISPIRRMPPELLCEIFASTLAGEVAGGDATPYSPKTPWRLASVSKSWRASALSYGPLWSIINLPSTFHLPAPFAMPKLGTQLVRSAYAALEVHYQERNIDPSTVDLVLEQCHKWGSLHLAISQSTSPNLSALSLRADSDSFPRLETLNVIVSSQADHGEIPDIFGKAPRLRNVILTDKAFRNTSPPIAIPWGQITHYRGKFTHQRQLELLNMASNLVECTIGLAVEVAVPTYEHDIITLPRLRRLYLHEPNLLRYLRTPLLADFVGGEGWHFASVLPVVALKRLTLLEGRTLGGPITGLRHLQFLEYLFIGPGRTLYNIPDLPGGGADGTYLYNVLTIRDPANVVCPNSHPLCSASKRISLRSPSLPWHVRVFAPTTWGA